MITMRSGGGIGNQLFNYAASRSLADRLRTELVIDAADYITQWGENSSVTRPFVLHRFPIRANFRNLGPLPERQWIGKRLTRRLREDVFTVQINRGPDQIGFFPEFLKLGSRCILKGHYIDPRFFLKNEILIRSDLTLAESDFGDVDTKKIIKIIRESNSVSVHVRRGDLLDPANSWILLPDMEKYYEKAFELIGKRLVNPNLYIFSDDPAWCKEAFRNVALPIVYVSTSNNSDPLRDFYLMTQCTHHVIANSTFSWWSAWLAKSAEKQVIAPFRWEKKGVIDMEHFIPNEWTRIVW